MTFVFRFAFYVSAAFGVKVYVGYVSGVWKNIDMKILRIVTQDCEISHTYTRTHTNTHKNKGARMRTHTKIDDFLKERRLISKLYSFNVKSC